MEIIFIKIKKIIILKNSNKEVFTSCKVCNSTISSINKKFELVACSNCKLVFSEKIFSNDDFEVTYNKLYNDSLQYNTHQEEFEKLKNNTKFNVGRPKHKILNYLFANNVKKICEIGAGVGIIANYLKNKNSDYIGIELDKKTVEKAQSIGLNIKKGDFSLISSFEEKFDAIIAFEVIEHLQDLNLFFTIITEKLNNKGYLGFTVPNYEKRKNYKNPGDKIYQSGPPIHLNFFTIESIHQIAKIYNFDVVFCDAKKFPYFNWKNIQTYKHIVKALLSNYYGSTIMCVIQKKNENN